MSFGLLMTFDLGLFLVLLLIFEVFFYFACFRHRLILNSREYIQQNRGVKQR